MGNRSKTTKHPQTICLQLIQRTFPQENKNNPKIFYHILEPKI